MEDLEVAVEDMSSNIEINMVVSLDQINLGGGCEEPPNGHHSLSWRQGVPEEING